MKTSDPMLPLLIKHDLHRRKGHLRAAVQTVAFVLLVSGYCVYNVLQQPQAEVSHRRLLEEEAGPGVLLDTGAIHHRRLVTPNCADINKADPAWLTAFYALGVIYMFLALAIVCDEFFVPALEEMSSVRRLNLSMDVAGATLMAAGGSAPELFTSLFGTFQESEIGFGTIVGSAVFNVLFVIAMCSVLSKDLLSLTWWPLFRDCLYYAVSLVVLAVFTGVTSKNEIHIWEAIVLFVMYFGYIGVMWKNRDMYKWITGKELEDPEDEEDDKPKAEKPSPPESPRPGEDPSNNSLVSMSSTGEHQRGIMAQTSTHLSHQFNFRWQGTFRAGILKLLRDPESWVETAGLGIVSRIAGDADYVFQQVDINQDGGICRSELKQLFERLECFVSDTELDAVFKQLDVDNDGKINQVEFSNWYVASEERILSQVHHVFDRIDLNKSNTIDKHELKTLLEKLDPHVTDEHVQEALDAMCKDGTRDEITFEEFSEWYRHSILYERQIKAIEEDQEGACESLKPPGKGSSKLDWVKYLVVLPLVAVMSLTIPDVRRPGMSKWCYVAFILSIGWIGLFAWLMVNWAEIIGNTIGIPSVIMGMTVLAAGTSVPDLLSSVIVARRGAGDMAVSSSVGSNIFDILVGLPVPWILFTAWPSTPSTVQIGSDGIWRSIFVLLGMLVFVVAIIHFQGWKLTKKVGGLMLVFYVLFLLQAILFELPFKTCIP